MPSTPPLSRRRLLSAGAAGLSASFAGCATVSNPLAEPRFFSGGRTDIESGRPLRGGPLPGRDGPSFYAQLFTSKEAADDEIDWAVVDDIYESEFRDIDYEQSFLAVFVTDRRLSETGSFKGWCPLSAVEGDEFVFELTFEQLPPRYESGVDAALVVQFEQWLLDGASPPKRAVVELQYVYDDDPLKSCSE
jgi:hypothetical protein